MSVPKKERFCNKDVRLKVGGEESPYRHFFYKYKFKDKGQDIEKRVKLYVLGGSCHDDLVESSGEKQYLCCDDRGEIYEAVITDGYCTKLRTDRQ